LRWCCLLCAGSKRQAKHHQCAEHHFCLHVVPSFVEMKVS
jgi:hypothetical protein